MTTRFGFAPATHRSQLQDGHPFYARVLGSSVWGNSLHAPAGDSQFLAEHGNFGLQLLDSCLFRIAICDQCLAAREHGDSEDADYVEYRVSDNGVPVFGKR